MIDSDQAWTEKKLRHRIRIHHDDTYSWSNLSGHPLDQFVKSAVLVPLTIIEGRVEVWLTQRSQSVSNHKGDVTFPGGMKDPSDVTAVETSLREAKEEIGLRCDQVKIVAEFLPAPNIRNVLITAVIGIVDSDFQPTLNEEVSRAFRLPLSRFLSADGHESYEYAKEFRIHTFRDRPVVVFPDPFMTSQQNVVTSTFAAKCCIEVACIVFQQPTQFVNWNDEPMLPSDPFACHRRFLCTVMDRFAASQHGVENINRKGKKSKL